MHKRLKPFIGRCDSSWRVDANYIKIKEKQKYLYRAVDKHGRTIDFYFSHTRNAKAAQRFLAKALKGRKTFRNHGAQAGEISK